MWGVFAPECRKRLYTSLRSLPVTWRYKTAHMTGQTGQKPGGNANETGRSVDLGEGRGQSATKRFVFTDWRNSGDHDLCALAFVGEPDMVPIQSRTGLATAKWLVVDRRGDRSLICNRLHDGDCAWPWDVPSQGEPVPDPE